MKLITWTSIGLAVLLTAGCATHQTPPLLQRGWIGGEYVLAKRWTFWSQQRGEGVACTLPAALQTNLTTAIQITRITTNSPAGIAGLRANDFIVEVNHQRVTTLKSFRRAIDRSEPGAVLAVKAWRDGRLADYQVRVGCEKYRRGGYISVEAPTVVERWDLWPNPGFSLVFLGFEPNPGTRHDLAGDRLTGEVYNEEWRAYLVFLKLSKGSRVKAEELAPGQ